jgi:hypothetical protein
MWMQQPSALAPTTRRSSLTTCGHTSHHIPQLAPSHPQSTQPPCHLCAGEIAIAPMKTRFACHPYRCRAYATTRRRGFLPDGPMGRHDPVDTQDPAGEIDPLVAAKAAVEPQIGTGDSRRRRTGRKWPNRHHDSLPPVRSNSGAIWSH